MAIDFGTTNANRLNFGAGSQYQLTTAFTVMCWLNPKESTGYNRMLVQRYFASDYSLVRHYMLGVLSSGTVYFNAHYDDSGSATVVTSVATLPAETYTHIAVTFDMSYLRLYLNGVLEASAPMTVPIYSVGSPQLHVGSQFNVQPCRSNMLDLRIYNEHMDGLNVLEVFRARGRDSKLSGLMLRTCVRDGYAGASLSSQRVYDHSPYRNHVTALGAPLVVADPFPIGKRALGVA